MKDIELKGADLTATALTMLLGVEGVDFCYYKIGTIEEEQWKN